MNEYKTTVLLEGKKAGGTTEFKAVLMPLTNGKWRLMVGRYEAEADTPEGTVAALHANLINPDYDPIPF